MSKKGEGFMLAIMIAILGAFVMIISPILAVISGWVAGVVIKLVFGTYITNGMNLLFNTARFTPQAIPAICSVLAVIGSYFKSSTTNTKS